MVALIAALLAMPLYLAYLFVKGSRLQEATYKVGGGMAMVVACALYPALALAGLVVLAATVVYFRMRFNIGYPSLAPAKPLLRKGGS